jgi:hypothetical protein
MALMLGQALDNQSFILGVTRNHRLRDSPTEIYQFHLHGKRRPLTTGVFYSYSCGSGEPGTVCYAYGCLSRKDIVKGLVLPANSDIPRVEIVTPRRETTWTQSVLFSVFESLTSNEIKRQEIIFEFIQGEFNYVQDLEALNEFMHVFPGSKSILDVFILCVYSNRAFIRIL